MVKAQGASRQHSRIKSARGKTELRRKSTGFCCGFETKSAKRKGERRKRSGRSFFSARTKNAKESGYSWRGKKTSD